MAEPTDKELDELLSALDEIARDYDSYEYGLPMHNTGEEDSPLNKMRGAVLSWLAACGVMADAEALVAAGWKAAVQCYCERGMAGWSSHGDEYLRAAIAGVALPSTPVAEVRAAVVNGEATTRICPLVDGGTLPAGTLLYAHPAGVEGRKP